MDDVPLVPPGAAALPEPEPPTPAGDITSMEDVTFADETMQLPCRRRKPPPIDLKPSYAARKELARERRPEMEEPVVMRRSERSTKGVPPRKYLVDSIQSLMAQSRRLIAQLGNWRRSTDPVKRLALMRLGDRSRNACSWGGGV
jgi:hypothetical protein